MRHRKLCLCHICDGILERIAGYFEKILLQRWLKQDFFEEFDCFWHKFHQILLKYPDISVKIWQNFYSKPVQTVTRFYIELRLIISIQYPVGCNH